MGYGSVYLVVKDFDKSLDFYEKVLNVPASGIRGERFAAFNIPGLNLCLMNGYFDFKHPGQVTKKGGFASGI